jgi:RNA polymerase sigma-70 factor, ECF subfamily
MDFGSQRGGNNSHSASQSDNDEASDDARLVMRLHTDPQALTLLYERYLEPVYRYCYVRMGNRERAEDATSDVFLRLLAGLGEYRQGNFAAWLYRIVHNVVVDSYRAQRSEAAIGEALQLTDPQPTPEDAIAGSAEYEPLYNALAMLNQEQRAVIELQYTGWADEQIAAALSRTPAAVRMLRLRAMQRLREIMKPSVKEEVANGQ